MAKKNEGALVPITDNYPVLAQSAALKEVIEDNLAGENVSAADLDRIKVPASGASLWEIPTLEGSEGSKELRGIILHNAQMRAYWSDSDTTGSPPDCWSRDSLVGEGDPGGRCADCPLSKFNSDTKGGKGQACKEKRALALLLPGRRLPLMLHIPPTSITRIRQYLMRLSSFGVRYWETETALTLEITKNNSGQPYALVTPTLANRLEGAAIEGINAYRAAILPILEKAAENMSRGDAAEL